MIYLIINCSDYVSVKNRGASSIGLTSQLKSILSIIVKRTEAALPSQPSSSLKEFRLIDYFKLFKLFLVKLKTTDFFHVITTNIFIS